MGVEQAAIFVIGLFHVLGAALLIWMVFAASEERPDLLGWWREDDDDDGSGPGPQAPQGPPVPPDGLPLADAEPGSARLRGPGRLADAHPRPGRRPAHAPQRKPARDPART